MKWSAIYGMKSGAWFQHEEWQVGLWGCQLMVIHTSINRTQQHKTQSHHDTAVSSHLHCVICSLRCRKNIGDSAARRSMFLRNVNQRAIIQPNRCCHISFIAQHRYHCSITYHHAVLASPQLYFPGGIVGSMVGCDIGGIGYTIEP